MPLRRLKPGDFRMKDLDRTRRLIIMTIRAADGIGNRRAFQLFQLFESPENVLSAPAGELASALNVTTGTAKKMYKTIRDLRPAEELIQKLEQIGGRLVTYWDEDYPKRLQTIPDPPVLLYIIGEHSPLFEYSVSIVGTRVPSDHAKSVTVRLAGELASAGVTIVSGMALGIDSLAHEGAVKAGGRTIAVLGSGIDVIYPPSNEKLYYKIVQQGAVISEYPPGLEPFAGNFPARNRIISGISLGTVVVEAGKKSGALITAQLALEQGRDLFAVPGPAGSPRNSGTNQLIKDGTASMVENGEDVIDHLRSQLAPVLNVSAVLTLPDLNEKESGLYKLLEDGPRFVDELIQSTGHSAMEINRMLTSMQMKGLIRRFAGNKVGRV